MIRKTGRFWPVFFILSLLSATGPLLAESTLDSTPAIAIVIDDLGKSRTLGRRAVNLPGPVACAFLPLERHTAKLAGLAHARQKEVLLHMPMESADRRPLDEGGVTLDMTETQFITRVKDGLRRVPYVTGLNNHMGSLLTRHPGHMAWLMGELKRNGDLYFVDSRTTRQTVALQIATEMGVPATKRNVFLDNKPDPDVIGSEFRRLLSLARRHGTALAIGHPYPETLNFLERHLPALSAQGIRLVPVGDLIGMQKQEIPTWQASLSHSPKAAKSLKQ